MKYKLSLILILLLSSFHLIVAQRFYSRNYTINEGLPDNCIRDLYKDSRGFLWIGTDAGLAKFDGKNFTIYTSLDGLAGDKIWSISESKDGCIWIGCYDGGISRLNGEKITSFNVESGLISDNVRKIYFSQKFNTLLIGTEDGLSVLTDGKFNSFHQKLNSSYSRLQITDFLEDKDFIYVFTNSNGIYKYNPDIKTLVQIPSGHDLNKDLTSSAFISKSNDTLVNINRVDLKFFRNKTTIKNIGQVVDYKEDSDSNIWIGSWNNNYLNTGGIFKYDQKSVSKYNILLNIESDNILSLEYDLRESLVWIGTQEDGLFLYPQNNFTYYSAKDFQLSHMNISDLCFDNSNTLWIASKNNIIRKNPDGEYHVFNFDLFQAKFDQFIKNNIKRKYHYLIDKNGSFDKYQKLISSGKYRFTNPYQKFEGNKLIVLPPKSLYKPLKYDILINKRLKEFNSIKTDNFGNIWVGSNAGIFKIDRTNETIKYYDLEGNYFSNFIFGPQNELYGVSWSDLFVYPDIEKNSTYSSYNYYDDKSPININKIKVFNDILWFVSHDHGLFSYNNEKFFSTYDQNIIPNQAFSDICFDKKGNLIIGGINGNLYLTYSENDTIKVKTKINKQNGLLGSSIRWLNCTNHNYLVVGTNAGINILDLEKIEKTGIISIETIDKERGFVDYTGKVSATDKEGNIWIGSNTNLIKFNHSNLHQVKNKHINFFIKSIEINDNIYDLSKTENFDPWTNIPKSVITLPHHKNSLTFSYDVIKFLNPGKITFSYKLEGYHSNWSKETVDRKAIFQNLEPGNYRLRIRVFDKNEIDTNQELAISFVIQSPLWAKWWFLASAGFLILSLSWVFFFLRTRKIRKRERLKSELAERINDLEMKALRSQMNPHFIFNAINSIQNYMLDNDVDSALNYLSDFAKLIRLTLDNVSKKQVTLEEELSYLRYYLSLEQMRFDKKFDTDIRIPNDFEVRKILIPPMIIQPYIENAIKHGFMYKNQGGKIKIDFKISSDSILKCTIEDNGIGRTKSRELNKNSKTHKSKGTFITNERFYLLNQTRQRKGYRINTVDLYDKNNLPSGTRVEIFIPI